jgi:hypothetical protein
VGSASIFYACYIEGSVLEYGSVCYAGMARTHMLLLERIQYRALRISIGLMGFTPNNSLGVLRGAHRYDTDCVILISDTLSTFLKNGHPLRDKLEKPNGLSPQKCLIPFHEVSGLDIRPEVGYTRHEQVAILSTPRVNRHMEIIRIRFPVFMPICIQSLVHSN